MRLFLLLVLALVVSTCSCVIVSYNNGTSSVLHDEKVQEMHLQASMMPISHTPSYKEGVFMEMGLKCGGPTLFKSMSHGNHKFPVFPYSFSYTRKQCQPLVKVRILVLPNTIFISRGIAIIASNETSSHHMTIPIAPKLYPEFWVAPVTDTSVPTVYNGHGNAYSIVGMMPITQGIAYIHIPVNMNNTCIVAWKNKMAVTSICSSGQRINNGIDAVSLIDAHEIVGFVWYNDSAGIPVRHMVIKGGVIILPEPQKMVRVEVPVYHSLTICDVYNTCISFPHGVFHGNEWPLDSINTMELTTSVNRIHYPSIYGHEDSRFFFTSGKWIVGEKMFSDHMALNTMIDVPVGWKVSVIKSRFGVSVKTVYEHGTHDLNIWFLLNGPIKEVEVSMI